MAEYEEKLKKLQQLNIDLSDIWENIEERDNIYHINLKDSDTFDYVCGSIEDVIDEDSTTRKGGLDKVTFNYTLSKENLQFIAIADFIKDNYTLDIKGL